MPTATSTVELTARKPFKTMTKAAIVQLPAPSSSSTTTTLQTLYNRAARAFLNRDVVLTQSLLESAFSLLPPPTSLPDALAAHRRKWDILRITLETTLHSSPAAQSVDALPEFLREVLLKSPHDFMNACYVRSLELYTPQSASKKSPAFTNPVHLPPQVLTTLVYSSLKLDCPDVGRIMIEEWLARRESPSTSVSFDNSRSSENLEDNGYEKILELYCIQILPKLEQWDYAKEFLEYESELKVESRDYLRETFQSLHEHHLASIRQSHPPPPSPGPSEIPKHSVLNAPASSSSYRPYSPTPSSSSSSSLSTTSTHTVVPATPRAKRQPHSLASLSSLPAALSSVSLSSNGTATPTDRLPQRNMSNSDSKRRTSKSRSHTNSQTSATPPHPLTLPRAHHQTSTARPARSPSAYALIKAALAPHLTTNKLVTFFVLFVLVPFVSLVLRLRRRRRLGVGGTSTPALSLGDASGNTAELVRRRLQAVNGRDSGILATIWNEVVRVVGDTIKMGGSGLV